MNPKKKRTQVLRTSQSLTIEQLTLEDKPPNVQTNPPNNKLQKRN